MSLTVNLRHLDAHNVSLKGELPIEELDLDLRDEIIQTRKPLEYDLEVQKLEQSLLVQGKLRLPIDCQCVRCLKPFEFALGLNPWTVLLPLEGDDSVTAVNDCVDLIPHIREDILLEFPQNPLCDPQCGGLPSSKIGSKKSAANQTEGDASAWSELNKLKLK